jgi:hypothetical protein
MTPFYYRGPHGEILTNDQMGAIAIDSKTTGRTMAFAGLLVGAAIMYCGLSRGTTLAPRSLPLAALGAGIAYFGGIRQLRSGEEPSQTA